MISWTIVHREYATRYRKPTRSDDAFYDRYPERGSRRWSALGGLWPLREPGR
jgi:hypothetical protein